MDVEIYNLQQCFECYQSNYHLQQVFFLEEVIAQLEIVKSFQ